VPIAFPMDGVRPGTRGQGPLYPSLGPEGRGDSKATKEYPPQA